MPRGVAGHGQKQRLATRLIKLAEWQKADLGDRDPVALLEREFKDRRAEPVKQQPAETLQPRVGAGSEKHPQPRWQRVAFLPVQAFVERILQFGNGILVKLARRQIDDGLNRWNHPLAARRRQQRGIIAAALIGVGAGQIDDVGPRAAEHLRPGQIIPGSQHLVLGRSMIEARKHGRQNYPVRHWLLFP